MTVSLTSRRESAMVPRTSRIARHSERAPRKNLSRAGALKNRCATRTVVPRRRAIGVTLANAPPAARTSVPAPSSGAVSSSSCDTEQIAASASPRKPKLRTPTRSCAVRIFDVAWRSSDKYRVVARHAAAVVAHANRLAATVLDLDVDRGGSRVERVLDQLFDDGRRTLDDFTRRDLIGDGGG